MAQVYADPNALETFLQRLQRFRQTVAEADEQIWQGMNRLRLEWRDEGYEAFAASYLQTRQRLRQLSQTIEETVPHLRQDIETLRAYLGASLPGEAPPLSAGGAGLGLGAAPPGGAPQPAGITMFPLPKGFQWVRVEDLPSP
ncbi:WXG100 family type VII secretion target, partial [Thermoflexus hugenholtzii]